MPDERIQRHLATILAADVVGYSRLMERDEAATLTALRARRKEIVQPQVARHQGRIFKITGDGLLAEFRSAVNALACAVEIQERMTSANADLPDGRKIVLRIGINLGDVMVEGSDRYGDGVNIAARLEGLAEPGGILISGPTYDQVRNKTRVGFDDLGRQSLKNIAEPVRVYRVAAGPGVSAAASRAGAEKPSIAVLPFTNMSSDAEQEFFADGLTEDLITDLSKVRGLFVIARHSTFAYKGKAVDIRTAAKELGVRYMVEGSVRRAAARVRINVQLIDASDHTHLWADRFDRDLADVFLLQDEVVGRIVSALAGVLPAAPPVAGHRATNLEAYDLFVRGRALVMQGPESRAARPLLEKSVELDPGFAEAHAWLAMGHAFAWSGWGGEADEHQRSLARAAARQAVLLDPDNALAHAMLALVLVYDAQLAEAAVEFDKALALNPNHADAWMLMTDLKVLEGLPGEGVDCAKTALRLNPHPPGWYYWSLGMAQYSAQLYDECVETLLHEATRWRPSRRLLAASLAQLGRLEEARTEAREFLVANPRFSISQWLRVHPFRRDADVQHFIDGYSKAGLPM